MAPNPAPPSMTLNEKIGLALWIIFLAPFKFAFSISRTVWIAWTRGLPLRLYVSCGFYRVILADLEPNQIQAVLPGTIETYRQWIKDVQTSAPIGSNGRLDGKLKEKIEPITPTSCLLWLGNPATADKIVLSLHGGGYKAPMTPGHLDSCVQAYMLANPKVEVAVAVLQYTLIPARYPVQLSQAADALAYLLKSGIQPENIIIGGDSAGSNLTAQLMSHLLHPHPAAKPIELSRPLLGAFMISPMVSSDTTTASYLENDKVDMLSTYIARMDIDAILVGTSYESERRQGKGWAMPLDVDESWLDGLGRVIQNLYVSIGQQEVFRSQGIAFAEIVRRRNPDVKLSMHLAPDEAHNFFFLEGQIKAFGPATKRMKDWTSSVISKAG
ncbi:alpha/beta-hydrolase [Xylaria intraflava]|nr:alpha/beta-hydrolase [Xylaria intraflava]